MTIPNFPVLIFDWSGVISDDRLPVYEANMRMFEGFGRQRMTFEEWLPKTKLSPREFFADNKIEVDGEQIFEEYRKMFNQVRSEGLHPMVYPEARNVLEKLWKAGKKMIVVSSHPERNLREEAKEYGVEKYFSLFVGNSKEKTATLLEVCKQEAINPSPQEVAYIGDTIHDIRAAKGARIYSIGIPTGYNVKEKLLAENPDKIIDSLGDLL